LAGETRRYTVSEYIIEAMRRTGTGRLYGIIGTSILDFLDTLKRAGEPPTYISTRHEQVAASAADAEARLTGRIGYTVVHAGPGFLNTTISLGIALKDRSPLFVLSGGVKRRLEEADAWLWVDQQAIADPLTRAHARLRSPDLLPETLRGILERMLSPVPGPGHLEVPEDLWNAEITVEPPPSLEELTVPPDPPDTADIEEALSLLYESERPLIMACGEANRPGAQRVLHRLAEKLGAYIVTTGNGRGACDEQHYRCLGRVGFGGGSRPADKAFEEADTILVLGGELDDIATYSYTMMPTGALIVASRDPVVDKRPIMPDVHSRTDPLLFAEILLRRVEAEGPPGPRGEWDERIAALRAEWASMLEEAVSRSYKGYVNPNRFFHKLGKRLPANTVVTAGQGTHIVYTYNYLRVRREKGFLAATNLGAMGYALPAGIGAALAGGAEHVITVVGDGELMMTLQDLETIARTGAPVKILVVNDNSYRVLLLRQQIQKQGRVIGTLHGNPDFTLIARLMGIDKTLKVDNDNAIDEAVSFILDNQGPMLVELDISPGDLPPLNLEGSTRM